MRVLVDCRGICPTKSGGIENYAYSMIVGLSRFVGQIVVDVDLPDLGCYRAKLGHCANVSFVADPVSGWLTWWTRQQSLSGAPARLIYRAQPRVGLCLMGRRSKWASRQHADVVFYPFHGHFPQHTHLPSVTTIHAPLPEDDSAMKAAIQAHIDGAQAVVTSWPYPYAELSRVMGDQSRKLFMIPYTPWHNLDGPSGVDLSRYQLDAPYYFYPAVIQPRKNHANLIEAVAVLRCMGHPRRLFVFAGGGDSRLRSQLEAQAARADVSDWIRFLGYVTDREVSELYRNCYATISVSLWEAGMATLQEGCAVGRPALCSRIAPAIEHSRLLGVEVGFFDPLDVRSIATSIVDFESNYDWFLRSAQGAMSVIRRLDYDFMGRRLADVMRYAAGSGATPGWAPYSLD